MKKNEINERIDFIRNGISYLENRVAILENYKYMFFDNQTMLLNIYIMTLGIVPGTGELDFNLFEV